MTPAPSSHPHARKAPHRSRAPAPPLAARLLLATLAALLLAPPAPTHALAESPAPEASISTPTPKPAPGPGTATAHSASPPTNTDHWAFLPLSRPTPPAPGHPVDAFIRDALAKRHLTPAPQAPDIDLVRRVFFDLIGLPPSPAEIDAYLADTRPDRWERLIDDLLARPDYGERWGRHWLDAVRFTESSGFEYDRIRDNAWPYRDYVIRAFNDDKPYDLFIREQIAGDTFSPQTLDSLVAPSLLVCGAYDQAGNAQANATQRATTREEELEDLVGTVGQTFLGLTLNCARCHDHKFDPIPLAEYYRIKSVFDGVQHGERSIETPEQTARRETSRTRVLADIEAGRTELRQLFERAARTLTQSTPPTEAAHPHPVALLTWDFSHPATPPPNLQGGATLTNQLLLLPKPGAFLQSEPIPVDVRAKTLEVVVALDSLDQRGGGAISLESADGSVFDAITFGERQPRRWAAGSDGFSRTRDLEAPDESAGPDTFVHLAIVYHDNNRIAVYRNGQPLAEPYTAGRPLPTFKAGNARSTLGRRHLGGGSPWLTGAIRRAALYDRPLSPAEIAATANPGFQPVSLSEAIARLSPDDATRRSNLLARLRDLDQELARLQKPAAVAYAGNRSQPQPTRVLKRGDVRSPGDTVSPGAISAIRHLSPDLGLPNNAPEAERRRRFADWITHRANPLPARVIANRIWQLHFGLGLVSTPNDFGAAGAKPSHPELLDWLASHLVDARWSLKSLHRTLCTSATYRQSAAARPDAAAVDAENTLLWRFSPRRLEAEALRDAMLAVSGQLNPQRGGPSFRPFTTTDFNATFYHPFDSAEPAYNRRTVYRMNVNSGKDPLLDAFDCPDPSVKVPRRGVTTTPLQALGLMNGTFVQRQAEKLAERALALATSSTKSDNPGAIHHAWRLALGRPPSQAEAAAANLAAAQRGLPSVCWALLNTTEFVYVR